MLLTRTLTAAALCFALLTPVQAGPTGLVVASVYWEGNRVATGNKFNPHGMTVAHRNLPFGTRLVVSYGRNVVEVVVNDRGPHVRGREIDLALGAAQALHFPGLGRVRVAYWPPLPRPRPEKP
jgi:rare lipoprotein A